MTNNIIDDSLRIQTIRKAEEVSHLQMYSEYDLFAEGSWLAHPVRTVMDLVPNLKDHQSIRVLDLGCGVGRNSIPIAKSFSHIPCIVDCVDILPFAIEKLQSNAIMHHVGDKVHGYVSSIEDFFIPKDTYDLIIAVSALEHICSADAFDRKLQEMSNGLRPDGIVCLIISTDIAETDLATGERLPPQFELNFSAQALRKAIDKYFFAFTLLKETYVPQQYCIPRDGKQVNLTSVVCTYILKKEREQNETGN